jgi:hypothetical protein
MNYTQIGELKLPHASSPPPKDKAFRDAWASDGAVPPTIVVDMVKARAIARDMIREQRKPVFSRYDAEFNIAVENEDRQAMTDAKLKRNRLRNATKDPRIEAAETPERLKDVVAEIVAEF